MRNNGQRKEIRMKKNRFRKACALMTAVVVMCAALVWMDSTEVSAATCSTCNGSRRVICGACGGRGQTSTTWHETRVININTGQTAMVPVTHYTTCGACGGTGRMPCPGCGGTGKQNGSGGSSSSSKSKVDPKAKVKNGTVLDATDGIGDYEDAPNLIDGKTDTKFNVFAKKAYIIWKAPKMLRVSSYTITTANDTATYTGRNPKTWVLYASNKNLSRNAKGWTQIHSVKNDTILKPVNFTSFTYKLKAATKPYQYFKLEIKDNHGEDCTQLAEFTLAGKAVTVKKPTLSSAKKSGTSLKVKWKKVSGVSGYQIQYSTSSKFASSKKVDVKGGSKVSKTIKKLKKKAYYVRVRAYKKVNGGIAYSSWSTKKKAK